MVEQQLEQRVKYLEEQIEILSRLAEISAALNSRVRLEPLLQHIMQVATSITDCEAASVLLWNNKTHELFFAASTTASKTDTNLMGTPVPMDSIAGTILRENTIVQVDDARSDPRHYGKVDEDIQFETRSLLGLPMTYKDRVIGVLEAINKRSLPWTAEDRKYLSILAAQAAVAIENAQLITSLRRANEALNELDKLKNDFIAIASHELRTPLGVIMGYASFLEADTDESTQQHAAKVLESALRLRRIIEDMVNLRYIKQNQADLRRDYISVSALMRLLQHEVSTQLDASHHTLTFAPDPPNVMVFADETRILMALMNLLTNAVSFTPEGGSITVRAEVIGGEARISVTDTGIGLEKEQLERVFNEFYQVEDHMTRKHGGLGIGLSIARAIVHAHGGRIWARSPGRDSGSTFTIALPIAAS